VVKNSKIYGRILLSIFAMRMPWLPASLNWVHHGASRLFQIDTSIPSAPNEMKKDGTADSPFPGNKNNKVIL